MSNKSKKVYRRVRESQPRSQGFSPPRKALGTRLRVQELNGPFPSCCLSWFRNESWCSTIVREMSLICIRIRNSLPFEWLCTRTRFEAEACSNSEMGYYHEVENQPSLPSLFALYKDRGMGVYKCLAQMSVMGNYCQRKPRFFTLVNAVTDK